MTEKQLRFTLAVFLLISHLVIPILIFVLYIAGGFLFDEMTTAIALIMPVFASYTASIFSFVNRNRTRTTDNTELVSGIFLTASLLFPLSFAIFLVSIIIAKAFNLGFSSFEQFKGLLAIGEVCFAVYTGKIVFWLISNDIDSQFPDNQPMYGPR